MREPMTSREIVRRCIEFRDPPRIGMHFAVTPLAGRVWPTTDFAGVSYGQDPSFQPALPRQTEWGYVMESLDPTGENMGEATHPPLGDGWHRLDDYRMPDFTQPARYAQLPAQVAAGRAAGKYVYGAIPSLMQLPANLRGMEQWYTDHIDALDSLTRLLDMLVDARLAIIQRYADAGVDGVITWDDMGDNQRVFVSPACFRQVYFPRYQRTADALHERGMHLIHHCCGAVRAYMDFFVEAGCDVMQLDQPRRMGIDWLGERYGGKICFWNPVDIQRTAPTNDLDAIRAEAHHQVWRLGNFAGGFMVKAYQQPNAIGLTVEASHAQHDAFQEFGVYPLKPWTGQDGSAAMRSKSASSDA